MKVSVITRHAVANYGSLLQSYSTQKVIESLGHKCEIINYIPIEEKGKNIARTLCKNSSFWNKNHLTRLLYLVIQTPNYYYSYNKFSKFRNDILNQTREYNTNEDVEKDTPIADIYCTGSDQVWGNMAISDKARLPYYLNFIQDKSKKCISFSASIGISEINDEIKNNLKSNLKKYTKILVREESAVKILHDLEFYNVDLVLDPTLLVAKEDWNRFVSEEKVVKDSEYILVYQLHDNKEFNNYVVELSKKVRLPLYRICPNIQSLIRPGKNIFLPSPGKFLRCFKDAKYIVTDSFHGTVFSILFNKEFIDILPSNKTGTRIENILKISGITNRIVDDFKDYTTIEKKIEWKNVNNNISDERIKSIKKLKEVIEG